MNCFGDTSMNARVWIMGSAALLVTACGDMQSTNISQSDGYLKELPEGVLAIAAKNQDLATVRIDPTSGCYVYQHAGPVETTLLPLRAANGRPICSRPASPTVSG